MFRFLALRYLSTDGSSIREKFNAPEKYARCCYHQAEIRGQIVYYGKI